MITEMELRGIILVVMIPKIMIAEIIPVLSFLYVCMLNTIYLLSFVKTPRKFIIAELSIRKLGSSSVLCIIALMKIRAYGPNFPQSLTSIIPVLFSFRHATFLSKFHT